MTKFENPSVTIGGQTFQLRCDGAALARLEEKYDLPFSEALNKLVAELNELRNGKFSINFMAELVTLFAMDKDGAERPTVKQVLSLMGEPMQDMKRIAEGISKLLTAHLPADEGTGDAGDDSDPK